MFAGTLSVRERLVAAESPRRPKKVPLWLKQLRAYKYFAQERPITLAKSARSAQVVRLGYGFAELKRIFGGGKRGT